ncbi:MAG TPA: TlpA disulfide reductase family protein [bacterium]|nr:TlpA disulfide reductase family protein [bacterium]
MRTFAITALSFGALVLAITGCAKAPVTGPERLQVGDIAPSFILTTVDGSDEIVSGKVIQDNLGMVVIFWSMTCPTCREALAACEGVYEQYGKMSMAFVGINFDQENLQGVRAFVKGENIKFPNVWDPGARITRAYRAFDYTFSVFVADKTGKLVLVQYDHPPDLAARLSKALDGLLAKQ